MSTTTRRRFLGDDLNVIKFADPVVKEICVTNWGGRTGGSTGVRGKEGEMTYEQAANVSNIGKVFSGNAEITSFEEFVFFIKQREITYMAFQNCSNLQTITLPANAYVYSASAFSGCSSLTGTFAIKTRTTTIPNLTFNGCKLIEEIILPLNTTTIGYSAFYGCTIAHIEIPSSVSVISGNAFYMCKNLPLSLNLSNVTSIGSTAFAATNIQHVTLGNITTASQSMFDSSSLLEIDIPTSVTSIGYRAFADCTAMRYAIVRPTTPPNPISRDFFKGTNNCPIYVPDESIEDYKTTNLWSAYATRYRPLSEFNSQDYE